MEKPLLWSQEAIRERQVQLGQAFKGLPFDCIPQGLCLAGKAAADADMTLEKAIEFLRMGYFSGTR